MKLLNALLDLIYPPNCLICGDFSEGEPLCPHCRPAFESCRLTTAGPAREALCRCPHLGGLVSPFAYTGRVRDLLISLKERQDIRCQHLFAAEMAAALAGAEIRAELIACVPTTRAKLRVRGFNHAAVLAKAVSAETGLPLRTDLLAASGAGRAQHTLGRAARQQNATGRFHPAGPRLQGECVLLVDDICTTGSTLEACAKALLDAGAGRVVACTAALTLLEAEIK